MDRSGFVQYQHGMPIFHACIAGLAWLGRQGTSALALSVFFGIALPPLAALFKHVFVEALLCLLALAFLRVEPASLRGQFRRPGLVIAASLWTMVAVPLVMCGAVILLGLPQTSPALYLALVLQAVAPPVIGSPALAALMGLDAALSLATLIVSMAVTPVTVPILIALFADASAEVSALALAARLIGMLGGAWLAAYLIRAWKGQEFIDRNREPIDGLSVVALFVFAIGLMDGVGANILARPALVAALTITVFALTAVLIVTTCLVMHRAGRSAALALGLAVGSRNMGLMVAAAGGAVPELTWLYFAVAQFPIYTLPHLLKPLVHRWIGAGPGGLPGRDQGVRRTADE
jgi:BASS family bile acid:Na+ symporter